MSALFDLLKRTIERVNNTPLLDKQGKVSETVIPDSIARVNNLPIAEQVIPDWDQNDPKSKEYIKNRPFYEDKSGVVHQLDEKFIPDTIARTSDIEDSILDTADIDDLLRSIDKYEVQESVDNE